MRVKIMRQKIVDAYKCLKEKTIRNTQSWKENRRLMPRQIRTSYLNKWRVYTCKLKRDLSKKYMDKLKWLKKKWKKSEDNNIPDMVREVVVKDVELTDEFTSKPRVYGGVTIDEQEDQVLRLPPKYGLYRKINATQCKIDVEEALNKLRWNRIIGEKDEKT